MALGVWDVMKCHRDKLSVFFLFRIVLLEACTMENILYYKGKPLVRCGNEMYYGNMSDKYIILIRELAVKKINDVDVGSKFEIQLLFTDPDIKGRGKIKEQTVKASFSDALELAQAWLIRFNV